jgi:hypothetical protein
MEIKTSTHFNRLEKPYDSTHTHTHTGNARGNKLFY